jgi:TatD DNase family protein
MEFIDTHTHLFRKEFKRDLHAVVRRAKEAGVVKTFNANLDLKSIDALLNAEEKYPDFCLPLIGIHPNFIKFIRIL